MIKLLTIAIGILVFSVAGFDQTTFHGNNARTRGFTPRAGRSQKGVVKCAFKTNGPVFGSPAVMDGVVFIGSADGNLDALE